MDSRIASQRLPDRRHRVRISQLRHCHPVDDHATEKDTTDYSSLLLLLHQEAWVEQLQLRGTNGSRRWLVEVLFLASR